jgi:hypothetical protein
VLRDRQVKGWKPAAGGRLSPTDIPISAILDAGCYIFSLEDMQHNQMIDGRLKIINSVIS